MTDNLPDHPDPRFALQPRNLTEFMALANEVAKSGLVPDQYRNKPADVLVAMIMGAEVGLKPLQALQSISVINNRPSLWGDGARALVMASGLVESIEETDPEDVERTGKARCVIRRKGQPKEFIGHFSKAAADRAGLSTKDSYRKYPVDMYLWRAFHQAARKAFPDIYRGVEGAEEIIDVTPHEVAEEAPDNLPVAVADAPPVIDITPQHGDQGEPGTGSRVPPIETLRCDNPGTGVNVAAPVPAEVYPPGGRVRARAGDAVRKPQTPAASPPTISVVGNTAVDELGQGHITAPAPSTLTHQQQADVLAMLTARHITLDPAGPLDGWLGLFGVVDLSELRQSGLPELMKLIEEYQP